MVKRPPQKDSQISVTVSPQEQLQRQVKILLSQQKYRQALEEIQKAKHAHPDWVFTPLEAEVWLLRGKQEVQKGDFKQGSKSLQQALQLGLMGETHYWLSRSFLSLNRLDEAIALIRGAFEDGSLPKEYSICYAKLLLLKGDMEAVEQLLKTHPKRFAAAQQHWIRGVLALKAQQPQTALASFQKIKQSVTPGDHPKCWLAYTYQSLHDWDAAATQLGLTAPVNPFGRFALNPIYTEHPILQRLALLHQLETRQVPPEGMSMGLNRTDSAIAEQLDMVTLLGFVEQKNFHNAAHVVLKFDRRPSKFPELAALRPPLLVLAGEQALTEQEVNCTVEFWQRALREQEFTPQLAINLMKALDLNEDYQELQRLITQVIKWLKQDYKQHPQNWTESRYKEALVYAHCRQADTFMSLGRLRAALAELNVAEQIDPRSPEVIGRRGLVAGMDDNLEEAIPLLTQAVEGGSRSSEIYIVLVESHKKQGNAAAANDIRRRFGKKFGDMTVETDVELPPWSEALMTGRYPLFQQFVQSHGERDPAIRACQIFVKAIQGEPTASGKVSLNQQQAVQQWDGLLQGVSVQEQVPTLQALLLSLLLFAKREKGIAALITQYLTRLLQLREQHPPAWEAYLVVLALKERDPQKLQSPLQRYLATQPQPGNALAQIQLQLRRYVQTIPQMQVLRSFIQDALQREPQNPLLLLAKATTFPANSSNYETFRQQGFEIARRIQDAKALQAFREEDFILNTQAVQEVLPSPEDMEGFGLNDMDRILEQMIRKVVGNQVPPDELKRMMPQLKQMMMNSLPPDFDDEDDLDFDFSFPTGGFASPPRRRSPKRKRR